MLGSTILNGRQHVGLQKLSALAGISHSCLGPGRKYKFITDDTSGESALVCSCFRIVESLQLTCAVGQLVHETLQAHQKVYHSGSGCLLFLAGAWSRAALDCLQQGITVPQIISAMFEGMEICADVCRKCAVSTEGLGVSHKVSQASCTVQKHKVLNVSERRRVKLSRHFCESTSEYEVIPAPQLPDITHLAEGLSHNCDDTMKLVVEAIQLQSETNQQDSRRFAFDVSKVMTCVLPGLTEGHACVVQGSVFLLSAEQTSVAHHLNEQALKVALITGDLSDTYRHVGFNRPTSVQHVSDRLNLLGLSREDEWVEKAVTVLLNLEVNLILSSGVACEKVIQHCCRHHILVVEKVKASVLKTFAASTGAVPVTYVTQLTQHSVGTGVKSAIWRDLSGHKGTTAAAVSVSTARNSGLVTAVLTSCLHGKLQALEDQFWACAYRLHHALNDRALLPGAGRTEMLCIHHLQRRAEMHAKQELKGVQQTQPGTAAVLRLMADGLIDYTSTIMVNSGRFSKVSARTVVCQHVQDVNTHVSSAASFPQLLLEGDPAVKLDKAPAVEVYDNLSVKQEAWRKALDLVSLVLQTDAEVITGVGQSTDNLMML
ncbi:chaperonin-containing T-complex member BBS12 [Parambassis ranga]|uniref:Chaperonin-containing T-complex member BBS12 n=1 Tax=Parambassis ranga TaxID=210632 RepID=A0A6P7J747_9TELE|nr:Bardet-Biedl syndrome 12 protein [Parambassis ranga]